MIRMSLCQLPTPGRWPPRTATPQHVGGNQGTTRRFSLITPDRVRRLLSPLVVVVMLAGGCGKHQLPDTVNYHMEAIVAAEQEEYETAIELITRAIEQNESPDALLDRARFQLAMGRDQEALADCRSGLNLEPDHPDLVWLTGEIEKPADRRFQGPNAQPPSYHR